MTHVRAARVDLALLPVERECVEASALVDPERLVEARSELVGLTLEPLGQRLVAPDLARELGEAALRVVDVALHLDRGDRCLGEPAVLEALRVAGVLPRLVREPGVDHAAVLDEAVAVAVAVAVDPFEREERGLAQPARERGIVRPAPCLRHEDEVQRRRVDRAVVARKPCLRAAALTHLVDDLPRLGVHVGSSSCACSSVSASSAPIAISGPSMSVCNDVIAVSRPKTVMNHGMPAANSGRRSSPVRMRSAARSPIERSNERRRLSHPPRTRGTRSVQAATTSLALSRSSSSCSNVSSSSSSHGRASTVTSQRSCGSSATPKVIALPRGAPAWRRRAACRGRRAGRRSRAGGPCRRASSARAAAAPARGPGPRARSRGASRR